MLGYKNHDCVSANYEKEFGNILSERWGCWSKQIYEMQNKILKKE